MTSDYQARSRPLLFGAILALLASLGVDSPARAATSAPTTDAIVAKARAVLGSEAKLNGLVTLKLSCEVFDDKNQKIGSVVFMYKKPASRRTDFTAVNQATMTEGCDGHEAWRIAADKDGRKTFAILKPPFLDEFINEGRENMYFYRGVKQVLGAEEKLDGEVQYRGAKCWKVSFSYPQGATYVRYFDSATGDLLGTVLEPGNAEFIEIGKTTVDGIVFPGEVQNIDKDGKPVQRIKINKIEINQPMDNKLFDVPMLNTLLSPPAAPAGPPALTPAPLTLPKLDSSSLPSPGKTN